MAQNARLRAFNPDETSLRGAQSGYSDDNVEVNITPDVPDDILDENGALTTQMPDGSVVVDFNPVRSGSELNHGFYANLADGRIDEEEIGRIANELMEDIETDIRSREEWLRIRERGIELLGYKLEEPRGDLGTSSAPLEGMATVRHPLLSEAVLRFQANARGELLPASGPVKVRNDNPPPPDDAPPPPGTPGYEDVEILATALEIDFNHYLTVTASEYYPDTDRMLHAIGFGGLGIKKVYNCPIRRRPVSDSVDAADFIVSNATTDLRSSGRITHRIKMRPSILKRMQIVGAYRDVPLIMSAPINPTPVEKKVGEIEGIRPQTSIQKPEELDQEIYETYCELDIHGLEHKTKGKVSGLRLPYKVSIHVSSRRILEIRRNWLKGDPMFMPRQYFVDFPFVPWSHGFYPLGLVHILGNTTVVLTAAWREMIDSGMFANFPGFLYSKIAGRQLSNQFRVPPGGGVGLDTGGGNIRDSVMPMPYKDISAAFAGFITHVEELGQRLGSTAETNVGEGKQDAPVGTTLALIEQSTKLMDAVHKRLHAAQAKEFQLLKERFREDPEAFWRFNNKPAIQWQKDQFIKALEENSVVPVADPNNPTSLHRIAKATAIKQLQAASPELYDAMAVDKRIMKVIGVDSEGLFNATPTPPPPDPRIMAVQAKAQAEQARNQIDWLNAQIKAAQVQHGLTGDQADRESRERIEAMKIQLEQLRLQEEYFIHRFDAQKDMEQSQHNLALEAASGQHKMLMADMLHKQKMAHTQQKHQMDVAMKLHQQNADASLENRGGEIKLEHDRYLNQNKLEQQEELHAQKLEHAKEMHAANLEAARKQAAIKPKAAPKK